MHGIKLENFSLDERPSYNSAAWPRRRAPVHPPPQLPPKEFARTLYAAQYMYIGTIFSFLAPHVFEERLERMYLHGVPDILDREACLSYCQILMIFAFGQMYSVNQWMGHDGPPGFAYFMQALQFLPELHEEGSVLFVEVLSLVGYFMQTLNRRDAAFLYVSCASMLVVGT